MSDQPIASGPAPYLDVPPYEVVTQLFSVSSRSRKNSVHSGHLGGGAGNIFDLFRPAETIDNALEYDDDIISQTEATPLKHTHDLRNPLTTNYTQLPSLAPDPDLISSYSGRRASLSTLKKIRSHSTIKHVITTGHIPDVETTVKDEYKILGKYSFPLVITFLLQYSLNVASVFSVGRIGKVELAAVSLAGMTANITGYCLFQGTSTSLDTLCAQAYGRRDLQLVGLHFLRCTIFLFLIMIPVASLWVFGSNSILNLIVDDPRLAHLASSYMKISAIGLPGFILFETLKRFLQAQNIFHASTYVILFAAPFNAFLNFYLVWGEAFKLGFVGAPIAIVCTNYIMAILLLLYTVHVDGYRCWCGFSKKAFQNWGRMVSLSINGCISVLSEWLAFEILTLSAARFGTVTLAAQSVIATICVLLYQVPFAISIATSTRIANFIGAASKRSAITSTKVALVLSLFVGLANGLLLNFFKYDIIKLFSQDEEVIELASKIIPLGAAYQVNDCLAAVSGGVLRGQGRQRLAALIGLISYYLIALPFGFLLAFGFHLKLFGLWCGLTLAIFIISFLQSWVTLRSDWDSIISESLQEALLEGNYNQSQNPDVRSVISHSFMDDV